MTRHEIRVIETIRSNARLGGTPGMQLALRGAPVKVVERLMPNGITMTTPSHWRFVGCVLRVMASNTAPPCLAHS